MAISMKEINKLSIAEKIILVEKIWDSIPQNSDDFNINDSDMKILERRINHLESGKVKTVPWNELKKKLKTKKS